MKKTITDDRTIITENGVQTRTEALYAIPWLTDTTPLPNGFDRELAVHVANFIGSQRTPGRTNGVWDQSVWRSIWWDITTDGVPSHTHNRKVIDTMQSLLQVDNDQAAERCGTTMCLAGWVSEVTAVDWVIDAGVMRLVKQGPLYRQDVEDWEDKLFVRLDWVDAHPQRSRWSGTVNREWIDRDYEPMNEVIAAAAADRGFTRETHAVMSVQGYAAARLGIVSYRNVIDPLGLFGGSNGYNGLLALIDVYSRWGVDAVHRAMVSLTDEGDPTSTELWSYQADREQHYFDMKEPRIELELPEVTSA